MMRITSEEPMIAALIPVSEMVVESNTHAVSDCSVVGLDGSWLWRGFKLAFEGLRVMRSHGTRQGLGKSGSKAHCSAPSQKSGM